LPRKLGSLLPVQNNTTVRYISPPDSSGRHTVHYLDTNLQRRSVTPDVVVCAVEGKDLDRLVQGMTPKVALQRLCKSSASSERGCTLREKLWPVRTQEQPVPAVVMSQG